ncbi:hypothetical protein [Micromonospora sp. L31]|uniref:hypothetical protein n=1 Tax=Micromonospora sp. L31 TaxID=3452213 RepID=UPI003F8ABFF9
MSSTMVLGVAAPAAAEEAVTVTTESVVTMDNAAIVHAEQYKTDTATKDAATAEYTEAQAADGRLVDSSQVHVAAVASGIATWETGSKIDQIGRNRYIATDPSTGEQGEIEDLELIGAEEDQVIIIESSVNGSGMTAARSMSGGTMLAKYCQTWSYNGSKVTGCVEKMKPTNDGSSSRDYYVYNRWGTAEGKIVDWAPDYHVTKFDMRSRPHASYPSYTKGLSDYFPNDRSELCASSSATLGAGSLTFSIGVTNCDEKYPPGPRVRRAAAALTGRVGMRCIRSSRLSDHDRTDLGPLISGSAGILRGVTSVLSGQRVTTSWASKRFNVTSPRQRLPAATRRAGRSVVGSLACKFWALHPGRFRRVPDLGWWSAAVRLDPSPVWPCCCHHWCRQMLSPLHPHPGRLRRAHLGAFTLPADDLLALTTEPPARAWETPCDLLRSTCPE